MSQSKSADVIHIHPDDNVCVALRPLSTGTSVRAGKGEVCLTGQVNAGHKIALREIAESDPVLKYGQTIGYASQRIQAGEWVHSHNLELGLVSVDAGKAIQTPAAPDPLTGYTFSGYRRPNGSVGTRNYVAVISNVNCSASVSKYVAERFGPKELEPYPQIDGVLAFTHDGGCGIRYSGSSHQMLNRVLGGIARHPNIGAYLIIGLGCEQASIGHLLDDQRLVQISGLDQQREGPPVFSMQDCGGTAATVEKASAALAELLPRANDVRRETVPASHLILATECGGSDAQSGITANPALGVTSDMIVACGGTSILAETTEIYGAEHLLTCRAKSVEVADKLLERIQWWKWYSGIFGEEMDNNPSLGNKEGGLTTIAEKSLGAVAKAGSSALMEVYQYAQPVTAKGMVVMDTPGFDPMSVTGMVAGGANIVVFTTGRGSCYGCKPVPSIKVVSNSVVYERLKDDMDIDAGVILTGQTVQEVGRQIFDEVLAVASGKQTKSEIHGIGEDEFIPWTVGPRL